MARNDATAKRMIGELLDQFGFDVVDAGPLSEGWRFEAGTPVYRVPLSASDLRDGLENAVGE